MALSFLNSYSSKEFCEDETRTGKPKQAKLIRRRASRRREVKTFPIVLILMKLLTTMLRDTSYTFCPNRTDKAHCDRLLVDREPRSSPFLLLRRPRQHPDSGQ